MFKSFKSMAQVIVNGSVINGDNIEISKNNVKVDGVDYSFEVDKLGIQIIGDVKSLNIKACNTVKIEGSCELVDTLSGDVTVDGNVNGNVNTKSGDVSVKGDVKQSVKTMSGDVEATMIMGSTSTMSGDIDVR